MLIKAYKTQDYNKNRLLEPEDISFAKIKTIKPLLYKDLYNLYCIRNDTDFQYLMF